MYPDWEQIFPHGGKVSTFFYLRLIPTLSWYFTYSFRATLFIDAISKEKETRRVGWGCGGRGTGGQWKRRIGEVVKRDSLVDPYAVRERGGLCVLSSGMSFYLSPKGNQNTDIMEELFNMLILMSFKCQKEVPRYPSEPHSGLPCSCPILPWSRRLIVKHKRIPLLAGHPSSILLFWTLLWGLTRSP